MTQITANLMEKTQKTSCSRVTVLALDGITKKHFGHYALLKIFPSDDEDGSVQNFVQPKLLQRPFKTGLFTLCKNFAKKKSLILIFDDAIANQE